MKQDPVSNVCTAVIAVMTLLVLANGVRADDTPYLEVWATQGHVFTREVKGESEMAWDHGKYVGGHVTARLPIRARLSLIGQALVEGASGRFVMEEPGSWTRAVFEAAAGYEVFSADRYSCSAIAGGGISANITGSGDADPVQVQSSPGKLGIGIHCRDAKVRTWANARAVWDQALGESVGLEFSLHTPTYSDRVGIGVNFALGQAPRAEVLFKVRVWQRGGTK